MRDASGTRLFDPRWFALEACLKWLEFSLATGGLFCLYCFVMANAIQPGLKEQVNWRKVSSKEYPIQKHIGEGPNSAHNIDAAACKALINEASSVDQKLSQQLRSCLNASVLQHPFAASVS